MLTNEITSRLLSQVALDGHLLPVFQELFSPEGCELYLKDPKYYVGGNLDNEVGWLDIQARARAAGEIAIGYFANGDSVLNPAQDIVRKFSEDERIICLAEDDEEIVFD